MEMYLEMHRETHLHVTPTKHNIISVDHIFTVIFFLCFLFSSAPAVAVRSREESRCENPVNVEDVYDRAIHDPRRNPPGPRRVEQQAQMEMFTNELYEEKAL